MLDITVFNSHQHEQARHAGLVAVVAQPNGCWRMFSPPDAPADGQLVECLPTAAGYQIRIACDGAVDAATGEAIASGSVIDVANTLHLALADTHLEFCYCNAAAEAKRPIESLSADEYEDLRDARQGGPAPATLGRWLEALGTLHRWTASRTEFYDQAASFVVDPVGLDAGMVLRREGDAWRILASHLPRPEFGVGFDVELVEQAIAQQQTLFHTGPGEGLSVVVSPLANHGDAVDGVVYGYRARHDQNGRRGVRYLEAQLVELLAQSVSSAMARRADDAEAARQRVTFQQSFAPGVVEQVELNAAALSAAERDVSVLFADLRGFAALCEQLPTGDTYALLNDVMDALTTAVMDHGGTLIDYYGDGLAAMWNAPVDQPAHVQLACRAAFDMLDALPSVSERWQQLLAEPLQLGIGIHTGLAQVGNIGSTQRLKYGPRGSTVNLASRLEQATKPLGTPLLVTREVASQLGGEFIDYRVCQANLSGLEQQVDLFAIHRLNGDDGLLHAITKYEAALDAYEAGDLELAVEQLDAVNGDARLPTRFLRGQVDREHNHRLGRRAGDEVSTGIIELAAK